MSVIYSIYIYMFILGKSWWFEKAKLIKHKLISPPICRWPFGRYFKKEKNVFNEQNNLLF